MKKIIFFVFIMLSCSVFAQEKHVSLLDLLPQRTLAVAGSPDIEGLRSAWNENHLHRLVTEEEVQNFIAPLKEQAMPFWQQGKQMLKMMTGFSVEDLMAIPLQEVIVAVVDVDLRYKKPTVAISINMGDFSQTLLDIAVSQGMPVTIVDHNALEEDALGQAFVTIINGNLIVTSDYGLMKELVGNFHGNSEGLLVDDKDFAATKKYMSPEGEVVAAGLYVSMKNILAKVNGMIPPPVQQVMAKAHIQDIHSFSFTMNLAGKDTKTRLFVQAPGGVSGLPSFLRGKPVDIERFARKFPAVTSTFSVMRLSLGDFLNSVEALINDIDPKQQMGLMFQYQNLFRMLKNVIGFDIREYKDIFGSEIATGNINLSGNFFSDQLLILPIKDGEKARGFVNLIAEKLELQIKQYPGKKQRILYFVNTLGQIGTNPFKEMEKLQRNPMVFAKKVVASGFSNLALTYDDEYLYMANNTHALLDYFEWKRSKKYSLSGNRDFIRVRESMSENTGAFVYIDQRKTIKQVWSLVAWLTNTFEPYARDAGIAVEGDLLPRPRTIARHFGLSQFSIAYENEGIVCETNSSAIVLGPALIGVAAGFILPAISETKEKAKQARSKANLRQMYTGYQIMMLDFGKQVLYPPAGKVKFLTALYKSQIIYEPEVFGENATHWDLMNDNGYALDYEGTDIAIFRVNSETTTTPIVWTKEGVHPNVRLVLFLDGHTETMGELQFQMLMQEQQQIADEFADAIAQTQAMAEETYAWLNESTDHGSESGDYDGAYEHYDGDGDTSDREDGYDEDLDRENFEEDYK